jgi:UDP-3-O-[3-hydroxymyristoyl] glucosamine N-acyltransferase
MKTLKELTGAVGGELIGDPDKTVSGIASIDDCRNDEITLAVDETYIARVKSAKIGAVLVQAKVDDLEIPQIVVADPKMAAFQIAYLFTDSAALEPGVSSLAFVDPSASIDDSATVQPFAFIGPEAKVGAGTVIHSGVHIGHKAVIGKGCTIHPNAVVGDRCRVGDRVILHNNVSIGADGFGFYPDGQGGHAKIPQLGIAVIGNDVEIGACSCVDRATFGRTVIGDGTKIDNQVQIAHNCIIGKNAMIVAQVGFAGSTIVEDNVTFAARSATAGHLTVGKGAVIGAMTAVLEDVAPGKKVGGIPARDHIEWKRSVIAVEKLPAAMKQLRRLEKRVKELEAKLKETDKE